MRNRVSKLFMLLAAFAACDVVAAGCGGGGLGCPDSGGGPGGGGGGDQQRSAHYFVTDQANGRVIQMDNLRGDGWFSIGGRLGPFVFDSPQAIAVDSQSRIYVLDTPNPGGHVITRMDDISGRNLVQFGTAGGSGAGQFSGPRDLVIDSQDRIYVADTANQRIVRFDDMTGRNWVSLGSLGSGIGQFRSPMSLAVDSMGHIYVADQQNKRIVRMNDMSGSGWSVWQDTRYPVLTWVRVDSSGRIYVVVPGSHGGILLRVNDISGAGLVTYGATPSTTTDFGRVFVGRTGKIFLSQGAPGTPLTRIDDMTGSGRVTFSGDPHLDRFEPDTVCDDATGHLYIASGSSKAIVRADDMQGTGLVVFQRAILSPFASPAGMFLHDIKGSQTLYVADTNNHRIVALVSVEIGLDKATWHEIGGQGSGRGRFSSPEGLFVDANGRIYICDSGNNRIVRMDDIAGTNWTEIGSQGSGDRQFDFPTAIWLDSHDRIYVADTHNNRIVRMDDMTGAGWAAVGSPGSGTGQFLFPQGVTVDSRGRIFVVDLGNDRIVRMDSMDGLGWRSRGSQGSGPEHFIQPTSIFPDKTDGFFIVTDTGNHRIVEIDGVGSNMFEPLGALGHDNLQFERPWGVSTPAALPSAGGSVDFAVGVDPASVTIATGGTATATVRVTPSNGFARTVDLSVSGLPNGVSGTFSPASLSASGVSTLTLTASASAAAGTANVTVTGASGSLAHAATFSLTVTSGAAGGGGRIAFTSGTNGLSNVFAMNGDGTGMTNLTHSATSEDVPRFSPDNRSITFDRWRSDESGRDLWVMHSDGSQPTKVTPAGLAGADDSFAPVFTHDATRIVFLTGPAGSPRLAIMSLDGSSARYIDAVAGDRAAEFDVAPDDHTIVFFGTAQAGSGARAFYTIGIDGTGVREIATLTSSGAFVGVLNVRYSRVGGHILFSQYVYTGSASSPSDIWVMNADGSQKHQLTHDGTSAYPAPKADGNIVFASTRDGHSEIYQMAADGSAAARLTRTASAISNISPDSQ